MQAGGIMPNVGNSAVAQLLRAAELEIAAVRRADVGNKRKANLTGGALVGVYDTAGQDGAERREYRYACRSWPAEFDALELMVRPVGGTGSWIAAEVSLAPDGRRRVVVPLAFPGSPPNLQVCEDDTSTWVALADRLRAVAASASAEPESARWILGRGNPAVKVEVAPERYVRGWHGLRLNAEQRTAVSRALASDVLFLWGPPGTGKTDVVSYIVEGCYRQGLNVLFLAPTKVAVDQALLRVCKLFEAEDGFDAGLVQRTGDIAVPALDAAYGEYIVEEQIVARLSAGLHREIEVDSGYQSIVRGQLERRLRVDELNRRLAEAERANAAEHQAWQRADTEARAAHQACERLTEELRKANEGFALRKQHRIEQLTGKLVAAQGQFAQHGSLATTAYHRMTAASQAVAQSRELLAHPDNDVTGWPATAALQQQDRELSARLKELDQQVRRIGDVVKARCRVKAATVARAVVSPKLLDRVDVVVIDEAGMVDLPSAWFAASLAGRRVILAGDFRQLPAVTKAAEDRKATAEERRHSELWAARDCFHAAGLVENGLVKLADPRLAALRTQYRMRAPICDVVNAVAYQDAPLQTGRDDRAPLAELSGLLDSPLILVDTSSRRISHAHRRGAHLSNEVHEAVIHEIIRSLQYDRVVPTRKADPAAPGAAAADRIGVIAPYRAQADNLAASLKYRFGESLAGLADTVHRFQGSERPIIVLDTVAGAGKDGGYFYTGTQPSSHTCRLLNVGLSRARDHLVVIADMAFLRERLPQGGSARAMVEHLDRHAFTWPVDQLVPVREAAELGTLSPEELARPAFFPADEVDRAVAWDIDRSRRSVEIFSPFLTKTAIDRWLPRLHRSAEAGIAVTVYTRPPEEAAVRGHVERLQAAGCRMEFRERMHEKVLILDDDVLWHGSLNLLSHSGSRDLMMRLTDSSACGRVRRILEYAREDKPAWSPRRTYQDRSHQDPAAAPAAVGDDAAIRPGVVAGGRLYLNVPKWEKEEAKKLVQARWNPTLMLWHVDALRFADPASPDHGLVRRWLP
jgi:nucleoside-triphosphatase THEP1